MKALVVHTSLNACGGGERVCLAVIEALKQIGFEVTLATTEPTDWGRVKNILTSKAFPDRERVLIPFRLRAFGIYARLLSSFLVAVEKGYRLKINTHGDMMVLPCDVVYMHFPTFTIAHLFPENQKYVESTFWKAYFAPYAWVQEKLVDRIGNSLILTNSLFSATIIRKFLGVKAIILHPPVDVETFASIDTPSEERENLVVSIGRYNPEKRYEFVLRVAREIPDVRFVIIGSAGEVLAKRYYEKLLRMVREMGLRNVELLKDVPLKMLLSILSKAKVYLHAMVMEHFGMAPVEAMAAGLVPVVHRSGGTYTDVIEFGRYGYAYRDIDECIKAIQHALDNHSKWFSIVRKAAWRFSRRKFIEKFVKVVEKVVDAER